MELLAIDDHIWVQRVNAKGLPLHLPDRDAQVFDRSNAAYSEVGLIAHPGKQRRFQTEGALLERISMEWLVGFVPLGPVSKCSCGSPP